MQKYKEKETTKYVIADLSQSTKYLHSLRNGNYCLVDDIAASTKFLNKTIAKNICNEYMYKNEIDLVVVPILITYEIIEE